MKTPRLALLFAALALSAAPAVAQPPAPANPQAPTLNPAVPLGMQRGTTLELTLTGTNLAEPTGVWASFPARVTIPSDANNGKQPGSLRVKIDVPKDAPIGYHALRVSTRRGVSNARLFCIDDLPQVMQKPGNSDEKSAQAVPVPCVVVGRANAEVTDYYKITVKAGQRVSFDLLGRRLGSAFDPQITLLGADGKELPNGFSNDAPGLQTDARLTYTFKDASEVLIAVRDVTYRGGPDFHYRLRLGDFPCATAPLPLAIKRGTKAKISFAGPNVAGVAPVEVEGPTDPAVEYLSVAPVGPSGLHGWPVTLHVSELDEALEKEPNDDAARATRLAVPGAVSGRFEKNDDVDHFVFAAKKGQRLILEAHTLEHGSPSEVSLVVKDAKGSQLLATNPNLPTRLDFTAPADGDYTLVVEHLHSWGGPDEVYRVTVVPFAPSFSLSLNLDRFDVPAGGTASVPLFVQRAGYSGPIEVRVVGGTGVTGTVTLPAVSGKPLPPNVPAGVLTLSADEELQPGLQVVRLRAKAMVEGKEVVRTVSNRNLASVALGNLPLPPRVMQDRVGLAVTERPPFALAAKLDMASVAPGKSITVTVTVTRTADFKGEVTLSAVGLPAGATAAPVKVAADETTAKLTLSLRGNAKPVPLSLSVQGTAKHNGRDWSARAGLVTVMVKK